MSGAFNEAIRSYISLALVLPGINRQSAYEVCKDTVQRLISDTSVRLAEHTSDIQYSFIEYCDDNRLKLNSREIQNAFDSAVALARAEALTSHSSEVMLSMRHVKTILRSKKIFSDSVGATRGGKESADSPLQKYSYTSQAPRHDRRTSTVVDGLDQLPASRASDERDNHSESETYQHTVDDLQIEELEIQLKLCKIKRQQKSMKGQNVHELTG